MNGLTFALDIGWGSTTAIKTAIVLVTIPAGALILGYVFLLKMMSHMQSRLGPMDPGGFHGWFQLVGDGIKFLQKEDIMPEHADRKVFAMAPLVILMSTFLVYVIIPVGPDIQVRNLNVGVFYALAVSSLSANRSWASVLKSRAEKLSSNIYISGLLTSARAIANRWRCPPEKLTPPCSTGAYNLPGRSITKSLACATSNACQSSSSVAFSLPYLRLSAIVPLKRKAL